MGILESRLAGNVYRACQPKVREIRLSRSRGLLAGLDRINLGRTVLFAKLDGYLRALFRML